MVCAYDCRAISNISFAKHAEFIKYMANRKQYPVIYFVHYRTHLFSDPFKNNPLCSRNTSMHSLHGFMDSPDKEKFIDWVKARIAE
jgi:hypothetical protein